MSVDTRRDGEQASPISRRRFLRGTAAGAVVLGTAATMAACARLKATRQSRVSAADREGASTSSPRPAPEALPSADGRWTPSDEHIGRLPKGTSKVRIEGIGEIAFEADAVESLRPDVFQPGHFSLLDVMAHLDKEGALDLAYRYDEDMDTHVIEALNGKAHWWYSAYYSAGWHEPNVMRMDMYPFKSDTTIRLNNMPEGRIEAIYQSFRDETRRLERNGGEIIIPELGIRSPTESLSFTDVRVRPHDVRADALKSGVVTALDALLSLAEDGKLSELELTWYEHIGPADPVDSYWVEKVNGARASGGCGFVYETGPKAFGGFSGAHIHIPADMRVIVSPEYAEWFWICLGSGGF